MPRGRGGDICKSFSKKNRHEMKFLLNVTKLDGASLMLTFKIKNFRKLEKALLISIIAIHGQE